MKDNLKIANEMLAIAKMLMASEQTAAGITQNDINTFQKVVQKKKPTRKDMTDFGNIFRKGEDEEETDLSDGSMDRIAEELLAVASELLKED